MGAAQQNRSELGAAAVLSEDPPAHSEGGTLNWEMIGAIGEIAGAGAVVLTLVYLARQVRDSALQDRRHQSAQLVRDAAQLADPILRDPEMADIFLRGLRDLASLDETQTLRFSVWMLNALRHQEAIFNFEQESGIHDFHGYSIEHTLRDILRSPGARAWWASRRQRFSPTFRAEVDRWSAEDSPDVLQFYDS